MKFKAIIFDLDGTAVPSFMEGMPSKVLVDTILKAKGKIKFSTASGRSANHCKDIWRVLEIEDPCIVSGGSQIINPVNQEIIWQQNLPAGLIPKIVEIASSYTEKFGVNGVFLNSKKDQDKFPDTATIVVALGVNKDQSQELVDKLLKLNDIAVHILVSWINDSTWDIHVTHQLATKKHAIEKLIEILKVKKEEVIGIGDGNNDLPLFESVGYKVAMGNAVDILKQSADYITDTLENDGMAKFIEEKILEE